MSVLSVNSDSRVTVDQRRNRQTPRPPVTFEKVLKGGASTLLQGVATVSKAVGVPALSAAIARVDPDTNTSSSSTTSNLQQNGQNLSYEEMQRNLRTEQAQEDLKLLNLQNEIQRYNRQIALVSNVMKARHETAKSAIGNIRS